MAVLRDARRAATRRPGPAAHGHDAAPLAGLGPHGLQQQGPARAAPALLLQYRRLRSAAGAGRCRLVPPPGSRATTRWAGSGAWTRPRASSPARSTSPGSRGITTRTTPCSTPRTYLDFMAHYPPNPAGADRGKGRAGAGRALLQHAAGLCAGQRRAEVPHDRLQPGQRAARRLRRHRGRRHGQQRTAVGRADPGGLPAHDRRPGGHLDQRAVPAVPARLPADAAGAVRQLCRARLRTAHASLPDLAHRHRPLRPGHGLGGPAPVPVNVATGTDYANFRYAYPMASNQAACTDSADAGARRAQFRAGYARAGLGRHGPDPAQDLRRPAAPAAPRSPKPTARSGSARS